MIPIGIEMRLHHAWAERTWWGHVLWTPEDGFQLDNARCDALNHFRALCIALGEWTDAPWDPCRWCGTDPCDCAARIDCEAAGTLGHAGCGWCRMHAAPRFQCPCFLAGGAR